MYSPRLQLKRNNLSINSVAERATASTTSTVACNTLCATLSYVSHMDGLRIYPDAYELETGYGRQEKRGEGLKLRKMGSRARCISHYMITGRNLRSLLENGNDIIWLESVIFSLGKKLHGIKLHYM